MKSNESGTPRNQSRARKSKKVKQDPNAPKETIIDESTSFDDIVTIVSSLNPVEKIEMQTGVFAIILKSIQTEINDLKNEKSDQSV